MIICGDFNSIPSSAAYELLYAGNVSGAHEDFTHHDYGQYTKNGLSHKMELKSAYKEVFSEEPSFTNYTGTTWEDESLTSCEGDFVGALDYIWYTDNTLTVDRVLQVPPEEVVINHNGALPNPFMCSDHVPIVADIYGKLVPKSSVKPTNGKTVEYKKESSNRGRMNKR